MKSLIFAFIALTAVSSIVQAGIQSDSRPTQTAAAARLGSIVYLEGNVEVDGRSAEIGQVVGPFSRIVTAEASLCEIVFGGKNAIRITRNADGITSDSAGLLFHNDTDVEKLAARIDERIDWSVVPTARGN